MLIKVIKKADDLTLGMKVLRISIGGNMQHGAYITYRGDLGEVQELLNVVAQHFRQITVEPEISPDDGKRFA